MSKRRQIQPREFTDEEAIEFKLAMRDPNKLKELYEKSRLRSDGLSEQDVDAIMSESKKRKLDAPLLDEEEMKIFKESKVYEDDDEEDETTTTYPPTPIPLEQKEKDMDLFKDANIDDYDDYLKEFDHEGGKRRHKTRRVVRHRKYKKSSTKKHHRKSKTHKKRKMHKKHRTHRRR
jgi:hypothetical protein